MAWVLLSKLIPNTIARLKLEKDLEGNRVIDNWRELINKLYGQEQGEKIKPIKFKNNILTVACPNSLWAAEIQLKYNQIIIELNKDQKPDLRVEKIRFIY